MMKLEFTKMQGIGNDFVVIDAYSKPVSLTADQIRAISDRHFGVGCDQLLIVERPSAPEAAFRYRIFNADGGEVEQCGNGARCFVKFVHDQGLTKQREICVETARGLIYPRLEENGEVTVNMGPPSFLPADLPFEAEATLSLYPLQLAHETVEVAIASMGNPHAVQLVDNVDTAPVAEQGPQIESHPRFPKRVNAGFMQIMDAHHIRLRVFERGSGETLACGTGACAAVVSGIRLGHLESPVRVSTHGGELNIAWAGGDSPVWMTGPAATVFTGAIHL